MAEVASQLDFVGLHLNPHYFNYGSLHFYLVRAVGYLVEAMGIGPDGAPYITLYRHVIAGRALSFAMGMGTIVLTWWLARRIFGERVGAVAAWGAAAAPGLAVNSHYATVDAPVTFWCTAALALMIGSVLTGQPRLLYAAGAVAGLATATKYGAASLAVPLLVSIVLARRTKEGSGVVIWREGVLALAAMAVAYLIACPFTVLAYREFYDGFTWELDHVRIGSGIIFKETGPGWRYLLTCTLPLSLSAPLYAGALAGLLTSPYRRRPAAWVLLSWIVIQGWMLSRVEVRFVRYTLPMMPACILFASSAACACWRMMKRAELWLTRKLAPGYAALMVVLAVCAGTAWTSVFTGNDAREEAGAWVLRRNTGQPLSVGMLTSPWFYTATVHSWNVGPAGASLFTRSANQGPLRIVVTGWDARALEEDNPDIFLLSEFEYADEWRLAGRGPFPGRLTNNAYVSEQMVEFWETLWTMYRVVLDRKEQPHIGPLVFARTYTPHDWLYPNPRILVLVRRDLNVR